MVEERLRLPQPGAVGVERHPELAGRLGERRELLPGRQQAAGLAQRQLQLDRAELAMARDRAERLGGRGLPALGQGLEPEPLQQPRARRSRGAAGATGRGSRPAASGVARTRPAAPPAGPWCRSRRRPPRASRAARPRPPRAARPHPSRRTGPTRRSRAPRRPRPAASSSRPARAARARPRCRRTPRPRPGTVPGARSHDGRYAARAPCIRLQGRCKCRGRPSPYDAQNASRRQPRRTP